MRLFFVFDLLVLKALWDTFAGNPSRESQAIFGLIAMGVGAAVSAYSKWRQGKKQQEAADENRQNMAEYRQQLNPMRSYAQLGQGKMIASLARSWGLDKILGNKYLDYISDAQNYPGTEGVGGAPAPGMPDTKQPGFNWGGLAGNIVSGVGASYAGGGGGGGVAGGFPGAAPPGGAGGTSMVPNVGNKPYYG